MLATLAEAIISTVFWASNGPLHAYRHSKADIAR